MLRMDKVADDRPLWASYQKRPSLNRRAPIWWHPGGFNLLPFSYSADNYHMKSNCATLDFTKSKDPKLANAGLELSWKIILAEESESSQNFYSGSVFFDIPTLKAAFFMEDLVHQSAIGMIDIYGGSAARLGYFQRFSQYLSIPGPGTGFDGSPHVCLLADMLLADELKEFFPPLE